MRHVIVLSTAFILTCAFALSGHAAQLTLEVTPTSVRVSNVSAGGEVILFSCGKRGRGGSTWSEAIPRALHDSDRDGVVTLEEPVSMPSVWIAVDLSTGTVATGRAPAEFPIYVRPIAPTLFRKDAADEIIALEQRVTRLGLLLVRPKQGAWMLRGREGAAGDSDGMANSRLLMAFEALAPVGGRKEKAPKHLMNGDVVVAVDLGHLDIFTGEVTK